MCGIWGHGLSGVLASVGGMVGLDDFRGIFQPKLLKMYEYDWGFVLNKSI